VASLRSFMAVFTESHKILSMNLTIKFKQFLRDIQTYEKKHHLASIGSFFIDDNQIAKQ